MKQDGRGTGNNRQPYNQKCVKYKKIWGKSMKYGEKIIKNV